MDSTGPASEFTTVRRLPARAAYDKATIHGILAAAMIGHTGVVRQGRPVVIPMLFGRVDDDLFLHGSVASQLLRGMADGIDVSFTATVIDGLVYARSAFHHSMNYRSVVIVGRATPVEAEAKLAGLRAIVDHITPGRWDESRPPSDIELRQTAVLRLPIEEASAKVRVGGPADDAEDLALPIWAGQVPVTQHFAAPTDADDLAAGIEVSASVRRRAR
jgi:nitroimidazol reductase NimA-like FMN-containing flavoprotein (pyridoxamine 5'-phosphate oxidase superfamily)